MLSKTRLLECEPCPIGVMYVHLQYMGIILKLMNEKWMWLYIDQNFILLHHILLVSGEKFKIKIIENGI